MSRAAATAGLVLVAVLGGCGNGPAAHRATETAPAAPRPHLAVSTLPRAAKKAAPKPRPRRVHGPHDSPVPVLEYHVIGYHPTGSPLEGLWVTPGELRDQVAWLAAHGRHAVTLGQVAAYWRDGVPLPEKPVVFSFDDGYSGDWRYALPILREHHFVGVLNLQIGNLVPLHVRQLIAAGWEIDAHTFTHPDLRGVSDAQLRREVLDSRFAIEREYHVPVPAFCYPFGRYDARVVAMVREAGYELGETENWGLASPANGLLTLDRIRVSPGLDGPALAARIGGA